MTGADRPSGSRQGADRVEQGTGSGKGHPVDDSVDVIVPCYNQGRFLTAAVSSLQAQSHTNWRALIVDDGSTDETPQVCERLAQAEVRVRYWRKGNGGISSARNFALKRADATYVQFLDADDLLESEKLTTQVKCLRMSPTLAAAFGNATYFEDLNPSHTSRDGLSNDPRRAAFDWIESCNQDPSPLLAKLLARNQFPTPSLLFRRAALDAAGPFNESMSTMEDWDLWIRLALNGAQFQYVKAAKTDALIRVHKTSVSHQRRKMLIGAYQLAALDLARLKAPVLRRTVLSRALSACLRDGSADATELLAALSDNLLPAERRGILFSLWLRKALLPYRVKSLLRHRAPDLFGL